MMRGRGLPLQKKGMNKRLFAHPLLDCLATHSGWLLFVEESLDAHLRSFLERNLYQLDLGYLAVLRELAVGCETDVLRDVGYCLFVETGLLDGFLVEVHKGYNFAAAVHYHRL